jgi:glycosyltransferase involved in cell wall biosynthesis
MHVLLGHEYYQIAGGEDEYFETRRDALRAHGIRVTEYFRHNNEIAAYGVLRKLTLAARTTWAWDANRELARLIAEKRPDIAHFGNIFPLMSPSIYYVCARAGVPVVQNLDNARLICISGTAFYRDGQECQECIGRFPWPAISHACYRDSRAQSSVVAGMLGTHRVLGTWHKKVDAYVVANQHVIERFAEYGIPRERMHLCPNLLKDPGALPRGVGEYAVFVGRLAPEKGVRSLLEAWRHLSIPIKIRGSGPMEMDVRAAIAANRNIELLPRLSYEEKVALIRGARFLVWPSLGSYETFGLVVGEAYACGVPLIASRTGVAPEMVKEGETGIMFEADNPTDLARAAQWAWNHPDEMSAMGLNGRTRFESSYSPEIGYRRLVSVYKSVPSRRSAAVPRQ